MIAQPRPQTIVNLDDDLLDGRMSNTCTSEDTISKIMIFIFSSIRSLQNTNLSL